MAEISKYTTTEFNRFERVKRSLLAVHSSARSFKLDLEPFLASIMENVWHHPEASDSRLDWRRGIKPVEKRVSRNYR
jgi:hypothetical protein